MKKIVVIKKERASKIIQNKHPWIFSGAVKSVSQDVQTGDIVYATDESNKVFAQAAYNPNSDIRLRVITWDTDAKIDKTWFSNHIKNISETKEKLLCITGLNEDKKNYRVIYSESDYIPGLVIDRYGLVFVLQFQTFFADKNRDLWISIIKELWKPSAIYERSDVEVRKKEGLKDLPKDILYGNVQTDFFIEEDGFKIAVDIINGQKTGYFLDLRQARKQVEHWCKILGTESLLNCFGYTGSFNLYAARAGVEKIVHIDSSRTANDIAERNAKINGYERKVSIITRDIFDFFKEVKDESVNAIILDPPSFVKHKEKIESALEGYERLNRLAIKKLAKNGILFSFCCSSYVSEDDFRKMLFKSASASNCEMKFLDRIGTDIDHTWTLNFPEGRYLQGWVLQKNNL